MKTLGLMVSLALIATGTLVACDDGVTEPLPEDDAPAPSPDPDPAPAPDPADDEEEEEGGAFACDLAEVEPLLTCAFEACLIGDFDPSDPPAGDDPLSGFDTQELMECALINCSSELLNISSDCQSCLLGGATGGLDAMIENCTDLDLGGLGGTGGSGGGFPFP